MVVWEMPVETGRHWCSPSQPPESSPLRYSFQTTAAVQPCPNSNSPATGVNLSPTAWGYSSSSRETTARGRAQLKETQFSCWAVPTILIPHKWISQFPCRKCQGLANYPQSYPLKMLKSPCLLRGASLCSHGNRNCSLWTPGLACSSCSGPSWLQLEAQTPHQGSAQLWDSTPSAPVRGKCWNSLPEAVSQCKPVLLAFCFSKIHN